MAPPPTSSNPTPAAGGGPKAPPTLQPISTTPRKPGDPYCANCGYSLVSLTDSSRCPECGKPLVEVLARWGGTSRKAKRYRSEAELFGVPIVSIAFGARPEFGENYGRAVGVIAIGDVARGGIALGGNAIGVVAAGGMAIGVASMGGLSIGALTALGGMTIGGWPVGGFAIGVVATGGGAIGGVAQGGMAIGYYGRGGGVMAVHGVSPRGADPEAVKFFDAVSPVLGGVGNSANLPMGNAVGVALSFVGLMLMVVALAAVMGHFRWSRRSDERGTSGEAGGMR